MDAADFQTVEKIAFAVVKRHASKASATGIDREELWKQIAFKIVERMNDGNYDPSKSQLTTWAWKQAWGLLDDMAEHGAVERRFEGRLKGQLRAGGMRARGAAEQCMPTIPPFAAYVESDKPIFVRIPRGENRRRGGRLGWEFGILLRTVAAMRAMGMGWQSFYRRLREDMDMRRYLGYGATVPALATLRSVMKRAKRAKRLGLLSTI